MSWKRRSRRTRPPRMIPPQWTSRGSGPVRARAVTGGRGTVLRGCAPRSPTRCGGARGCADGEDPAAKMAAGWPSRRRKGFGAAGSAAETVAPLVLAGEPAVPEGRHGRRGAGVWTASGRWRRPERAAGEGVLSAARARDDIGHRRDGSDRPEPARAGSRRRRRDRRRSQRGPRCRPDRRERAHREQVVDRSTRSWSRSTSRP